MIYIIIIAGLLIDQITKYLAILYLKNGNTIILIKDWIELTYVENRGVAFGSFSGYKNVFIVISVIAFISILYYVNKKKKEISTIERILYILIATGAIGNAIDRILYTFVVDFIHSNIGGLYSFPVFNFADIYISISCISLIIISLFKREAK